MESRLTEKKTITETICLHVSLLILAFAKKQIKMGKKEAKINPLDAVMRQVFEWVQNLQELLGSDEEIADRLTRIMKRSFAEVLNIS